MRFGAAYTLDPIHIIGQGPANQSGIFANVKYSDLPTAESDSFTLDDLKEKKSSGLLLLALLAGGVFLAVRA